MIEAYRPLLACLVVVGAVAAPPALAEEGRDCRGLDVRDFLKDKECLAAVAKRAQEYDRQHPHPIQPMPPETPAGSLVPNIPTYEAAIAGKMNDPFTTQFRHVYVADGCPGCTGSGAGEVHVCGEMITKNGFGAYTGWQRFNVTMRGEEVRSFEPDAGADFNRDAYSDCVRRGVTDGK